MKLKGKKIEKKTKPLIKKGREGTTITYSLPEINIYPNNRFGDIARTQGLQRARNWRKVKEGTTAGMNQVGSAINSTAQIVSSFIPVVSDVQDAKDFYDSYKNKDFTGMLLAGTGFLPFIGGFASNANKARKFINTLDNINWNKLSDAEWDNLYTNAVLSGNMEEAQKIRDMHFKTKSNTKIVDNEGNLKHTYRGDDEKYNTFLENHNDPDVGQMNGVYTTFDKNYAKSYGKEISDLYIKSDNPLRTKGSWTGVINNKVKDKITSKGFDTIINNNFDQIPFPFNLLKKNRTENITFKSSDLKLSNPITYDDTGNIIPISKRDNFNNPDIRYSIIPLTLFGTSLYNRKKNEQKKSSKN